MDDILQLRDFIDENKLDDFVLLNLGRPSKYKKLYTGIKNGTISNDIDAQILLFNSHNKSGLWRVKKTLREKLFEIILTLNKNDSKYSNLKQNHLTVLKYFVISEYLSKNKYRKISILINEETLKIAQKIDYTEYVYLIATKLYIYYAYINVSTKEYIKYGKILSETIKVLNHEHIAHKYYVELSYLDANNNTNKSLFLNKLYEYSNKLNSIETGFNSFKFYYCKYSIISTKNFFDRDYNSLLQNADNALVFFSKKPYETKLVNISFITDKIFGNIMLGKHDVAEDLILFLRENVRRNTFSYFKSKYYSFINYIFWKKYYKLYGIVNDVTKDKTLKLFKNQYENWKIREAYVHFLIEAGIIKLSQPDKDNYKSFKLGKFINDVPIYSKDKRGKNISILIVQMLFFIVRGQNDNAIERIDSLKQYTYRYLRNDDTFRSNCFIKMLVNIPEANFYRARVKARSKSLELKLLHSEFSLQGINKDIEIIPFNFLWNIIMNVLEDKK